jgi:hypothetical protein
MCVDCVLASPRIAQVDPSDEPLHEVVLSHCLCGPRCGAACTRVAVTVPNEAEVAWLAEDHRWSPSDAVGGKSSSELRALHLARR